MRQYKFVIIFFAIILTGLISCEVIRDSTFHRYEIDKVASPDNKWSAKLISEVTEPYFGGGAASTTVVISLVNREMEELSVYTVTDVADPKISWKSNTELSILDTTYNIDHAQKTSHPIVSIEYRTH